MKKSLFLFTSLAVIICLSTAALALEPLTEDRETHGDWVGKYGKDGYIIFNPDVDEPVTRETLPDYVESFSYTDLYEEDATRHSWWSGTDDDTSGITENLGSTPLAADALWTDETKTSRTANCIYSGDGVMVTVDTGNVTAEVTLYSLDWDNNGRVMLVTVYDGDGNAIAEKEVGSFQRGVYLTTEITGKAVFEYVYLDAENMDSPSNAVVAGVFFDSAEAPVEPVVEPTAEPEPAVEEPAEDPAAEAPVIEEPAAPEAPVAAEKTVTPANTAPQTFDMSVILVALTGVLGMGAVISRKK